MSNYRIFVEKKPGFRVEAKSLLEELNENLQLKLRSLRLLNVYDLFGFSPDLLEKSRYNVFGEVVTDSVTDDVDLEGSQYIAVEYLPGQFDQRAASAVDCVHLIDPKAEISIKSSKLLIVDEDASEEVLEKIRRYVINPVESRLKDLGKLTDTEHAAVKPVQVLEGFRKLEGPDLKEYCRNMGLAMNEDDLAEVVRYFTAEGRDPNETELRILDTYWSDHCRHTTFTTELEDLAIEDSFIKEDIQGTLNLYLKMRKDLGREGKGLNLMDMATIGARYLRKAGKLDDMEV
ncbi:MAG: phosphoribosylformylglycinamidine synthase, partial [Bacteroidales bacterium]|nr:phosphoribosylformylglycinamidine synthase [Bacteroidales bacterium]